MFYLERAISIFFFYKSSTDLTEEISTLLRDLLLCHSEGELLTRNRTVIYHLIDAIGHCDMQWYRYALCICRFK